MNLRHHAQGNEPITKKTNTICFHLYEVFSQTHKVTVEWWLPGTGEGSKRSYCSMGIKFQF